MLSMDFRYKGKVRSILMLMVMKSIVLEAYSLAISTLSETKVNFKAQIEKK